LGLLARFGELAYSHSGWFARFGELVCAPADLVISEEAAVLAVTYRTALQSGKRSKIPVESFLFPIPCSDLFLLPILQLCCIFHLDEWT
jgi:hypothetical protein